MRKPLALLGALAFSAPVALLMMGSDHNDGPSTTADQPADITDLYAWHNATTNTMDIVLDFAGLRPPGSPAIYDADVLYSIHINRNNGGAFNNNTDAEIDIRFAQNSLGAWGVQVVGLPGASGPISGAVSTTLGDGTVRKVFAGPRDDPFFFDLDGFHATVATGQLMFNSHHDTFAGTNVTAVVMEMALSDITAGGTAPKLSLWATTGRMPETNSFSSKYPTKLLALR